jgi:hypothetical protein
MVGEGVGAGVVGVSVGAGEVGDSVGASEVGASVGKYVGAGDGSNVGARLGAKDGVGGQEKSEVQVHAFSEQTPLIFARQVSPSLQPIPIAIQRRQY